MREKRRILVLTIVLLGVVSIVTAASTTWTLKSALKQMDESSKGFHTAVAEVEITAVDGADSEPRTGSGKAHFAKDESVRFDLSSPEEKTLLVSGSQLYDHQPDRAIVEQFAAPKHPEKLAPYAALGFSVTGKKLEKDFVVSLLGEESLDGRNTLLIELTPKSDDMRASVSRIQLWIEQGAWLPVQQKIFHGGAGTHVTARYRNLSRNVPVEDALFKPKWPKGTRVIKH